MGVRRGATGGSGMRMMPEPGSEIKGHYAGWLNVFFPYNETRIDSQPKGWGNQQKKNKNEIKSAEVVFNEYCVPYSKSASYVLQGYTNTNFDGMRAERFPLGIGSAPVLYIDLKDGKEYDLKFVSDFWALRRIKRHWNCQQKLDGLLLKSDFF